VIQKVQLPKLGQTMEKARVERWLVAEGDAVKRGQVLLEITTDKATLEVESYVEGTLREILAKEGEEVPVNDTIAIVGDPGEEIPEEARKRLSLEDAAASGESKPAAAKTSTARRESRAPVPGAAPAGAPGRPAPPPVVMPGISAPPGPLVQFHEPVMPLGGGGGGPKAHVSPRAKRAAAREHLAPGVLTPSGEGGRVTEKDVSAYADEVRELRVTPAAKRLAEQRGVDLRAVEGTGASGRITVEDVESAPAGGGGGAPGFEKRPFSEMRRIIAERMTYSQQTIPQFYVTQVADMTEAMELRKKIKAEGTKVGFNDMIVKAVALAIVEQPEYAAFFDGDGLVYRSDVNIGVAVSLESGGLIVPVVRNADKLSLVDLSEASKALIEKARTNKLVPEDYQGSVFTVSNLGMFGVEHFTAIVQPGESGILAVGQVARRPVAVGKSVEIRATMNVTLTSDHRIVDGVMAAKFCDTVRNLLEEPELLL